jgi:hypothetical protein
MYICIMMNIKKINSENELIFQVKIYLLTTASIGALFI